VNPGSETGLCSACASESEPSDSLDDAQRTEIDAFVESALQRYDVPGVAIAVIKDGRSRIRRASEYATRTTADQ